MKNIITTPNKIAVSLALVGILTACDKGGGSSNPIDHTGITGAIAVMLSGDSSQTKIQYMPDMAIAPLLKPQRNYLEPPEGSVAMTAILYPKTIEEAEATLKNPLPADPQVLAQGEKMFNTFCIPCHGAAAKGDGSITDLYPRPPDITAEMYQKHGDGFFFYRITFGANIMPAYGHATAPQERWAIVHYLRKLQGVAK